MSVKNNCWTNTPTQGGSAEPAAKKKVVSTKSTMRACGHVLDVLIEHVNYINSCLLARWCSGLGLGQARQSCAVLPSPNTIWQANMN